MNTETSRKLGGIQTIVILAILISIAALIWWVNTVLAIILVFSAFFVVTFSLCNIPEDTPTRPARRRTSRSSPWRFVSLEEMVERSEELVDIFDSMDESEGFSVPVDGMKGLSASLPHELPVEIVSGIDEICGESLRNQGVADLEQLAEASVDEVALACSVTKDDAARWIFEANGIVKGAGITSSLELAMSQPGELLIRINEAIENGRIEIPKDREFSEKTLRSWIRAAKRAAMLTSEDLRRLRDER